MKTTLVIITALLLACISLVQAQQFDFTSKTQVLIPEKEYLPQADWDKLFYDDTQKNTAARVGLNKQVAFAPDGSVFISDRSNYSVTKLDKAGRIVKTFGKNGWNPGEFAYNQDMHGILDSKYLIFTDGQGRINFFDLNGNFVKMITIDFMALNIYPAPGRKLIVQGHVPYGTKSKKLLAELDFDTEQYKQIHYTFLDYDDPKGGISIPSNEGTMSFGPPFSSRRTFYRATSGGEILSSSNNSDVVEVFSPAQDGYNRSEFKLGTTPIPITEKEKDEYYQKFKKRLEDKGMDPALAEKMKEPGYFPDFLPYYYNVILDGQNNILFFIYSNENKDHLFKAYTISGKFLGESELKIQGDYDLMSKIGTFKFIDGYVYTLALKKNEDKPLRIIKCKITQ